MRPHARTPLLLAATACLAVAGTLLIAGPLDPPAGPVTPTHKTLTEVEPRIAINAVNTPGDGDSLYRITTRGSYYLTGIIIGVDGKHGIEIATSGVTLDLNGFDVLGFGGGTSLDGISATTPGISAITIRNGSVRRWGGSGVHLDRDNSNACIVEGVIASANTSSGIVAGNSSTVSGCSAYQNGDMGIAAGRASTVAQCAAYENAGDGISLYGASTATNCGARDNIGHGIWINSNSSIAHCASQDNGGDGFNIGYGSTVTNCTAALNGLHGFNASSYATISDCSANQNGLGGIRAVSYSIIRSNTCSGGGPFSDRAGIHVVGTDNRIEGNNCAFLNRGIDVDGSGNYIVGNTCSDNALNWTIAADNVHGPIINRTAPASPAVSGNSATGTLSTSDSHANFSY